MASISNLVINVDTSQLEKAISLTKELKELLGGITQHNIFNVTVTNTEESQSFSGDVHSKIIETIKANCN